MFLSDKKEHFIKERIEEDIDVCVIKFFFIKSMNLRKIQERF